ncbi:uncharacterized protein LOC103873683 [Brassica rapa]|uniref:uncharacterized protein LOC103873683 n=1 Tax=Brassica campestris TaxID=3711 RepID=UPI0004F17A72|nr:uncharacterized protein LOC103873683 [Brassica rapa]
MLTHDDGVADAGGSNSGKILTVKRRLKVHRGYIFFMTIRIVGGDRSLKVKAADMKFGCSAPVVAPRVVLSKTVFVKSLRLQPLPPKIFLIALMWMASDVPPGVCREHTVNFSSSWFVAVHAVVPFIPMLGNSVLMPKAAMAKTIGASILGQLISQELNITVSEQQLRIKFLKVNKIYDGSDVAKGNCADGEGVTDGY